jgi:hypothetical protein
MGALPCTALHWGGAALLYQYAISGGPCRCFWAGPCANTCAARGSGQRWHSPLTRCVLCATPPPAAVAALIKALSSTAAGQARRRRRFIVAADPVYHPRTVAACSAAAAPAMTAIPSHSSGVCAVYTACVLCCLCHFALHSGRAHARHKWKVPSSISSPAVEGPPDTAGLAPTSELSTAAPAPAIGKVHPGFGRPSTWLCVQRQRLLSLAALPGQQDVATLAVAGRGPGPVQLQLVTQKRAVELAMLVAQGWLVLGLCLKTGQVGG